ncbi:MAG TPA: hypothetical protein VGM07_06165 [Stellaceae bacterium]|jgi:hypothetical protein
MKTLSAYGEIDLADDWNLGPNGPVEPTPMGIEAAAAAWNRPHGGEFDALMRRFTERAGLIAAPRAPELPPIPQDMIGRLGDLLVHVNVELKVMARRPVGVQALWGCLYARSRGAASSSIILEAVRR